MTAFFTFAYNASATLPRTIESVLAQTYQNWIYYLCDDGSTSDNTREIIAAYAEKDSRIIPIYMDVNDPYEASRIGFSKIFTSNADYFCMLDADDEYDPRFLEKSLQFMNEASLDIAASGSDFINAQTLRKVGERKTGHKIILHDQKSFQDFFPLCHQFMRTIWGKVYKVSLFRNFDYCSEDWEYYKVPYGGDTIFFMKTALYAKRIGVLNETLHKYYISPKSSSYQWNPMRPEADKVLYDYANAFLNAKAGFVSHRNKNFLDAVYLNAVNDTLKALLPAHLAVEEKLQTIHAIFCCPYTISAVRNSGLEVKGFLENIFHAVQAWPEMKKTADGIWLGLTFSALLGDQNEYTQYSIYNIQYLMESGQWEEAEQELTEWEKILPDHLILQNLRLKLRQR